MLQQSLKSNEGFKNYPKGEKCLLINVSEEIDTRNATLDTGNQGELPYQISRGHA